ncbi:MAG: thioredoxin domain-containing protein [Planctomycetota bacterium]|nr:thioredoxin domain-containing protein [Planctomycetota bacterium]
MANSYHKMHSNGILRSAVVFGFVGLFSGCTGSGLAERFNFFGSRDSELEREVSQWDAPGQASTDQVNSTPAAQPPQVGAALSFPAQQQPQRPVSAQPVSAQTASPQTASPQTASPRNTAYRNVKPAVAQRRVPVLHTLGPGESLDQIVQQAPGVVLLDFYADWCGPCRKQGKTLHQLESTANQLGATIIKVDVDQHKEVAQRFQAERLPTLVVLKGGRAVKRKIGLTDRQTLSSWLAL